MNALDEFDDNPDDALSPPKQDDIHWLSFGIGAVAGMTIGCCVLAWMVIKEII